MDWAGAKSRAREAVHGAFGVPAILLSGGVEGTPSAVTVRLHPREEDVAMRLEAIGRAIFWRADLDTAPARNDVLSVAAGEAYRIEVIHPRDGETVAAELTRLNAVEAEGLPLPNDA
jgi:hypothetical protein